MSGPSAAAVRCLVLAHGPPPDAVLEAIAGFLTGVSAYWIAAALALLFFTLRRRAGLPNTLVTVVIVWLILLGLGAALGVLIPCLAPDAQSAFGLVVALALAFLLPLRAWQRALPLGLVALTAGTRAASLGCQVPGQVLLAALALLLAAGLLWLLGRWPPAHALWQRLLLALDDWAARAARFPLTPTVEAVLAARLRQHLGFTVGRLQPLDAGGVHASTPVVLTGRGPDGGRRRYFVKIVSRQNWQSSLVYQSVRWLRLRGRVRIRLPWPSLKAWVEYEHYMLLLFADIGVPVPRARGVYRLERQAFALVSDYMEGVRSLRDAGRVSARYVARALRALERMRDADCAHRDIKTSNLVILPGEEFAIVDLALADYVAGPKQLAHDLADMVAALSMHHDPAKVVATAHEILGASALRRARAYLHPALINDETRRLVPPELLPELRRIIARETAVARRRSIIDKRDR